MIVAASVPEWSLAAVAVLSLAGNVWNGGRTLSENRRVAVLEAKRAEYQQILTEMWVICGALDKEPPNSYRELVDIIEFVGRLRAMRATMLLHADEPLLERFRDFDEAVKVALGDKSASSDGRPTAQHAEAVGKAMKAELDQVAVGRLRRLFGGNGKQRPSEP